MKNICFLLITIYATTVFGQSVNRIDGSKISVDSLDNKINYLMKQANVSGIAISIFNNNKPVYSKSFGYSNTLTKKPLNDYSVLVAACFSKMVFTYIVLQLVAEKVIDLDKPLVNYLKRPLTEYQFTEKNRGYKDLENDDRYKIITARMCLTHTTGFPNWRWFEEDDKLKILFEPGTRYRYSGEGLFLLQFVIEQILGEDYETISQKRVFKPLQMNQSCQIWKEQFDSLLSFGHDSNGDPYKPNKRTKPNAAGSMSTTLTDFTKFYAALIIGKGLKKSLFKEMTNTQVRIKSIRQFGPLSMVDGTDNDAIQLGYGFGVGVLNSPYGKAFFKEGNDDGWQHYSICFTDKKIAIVIMTNSDNGDSIFKELLEVAIGDKYTPWQWENYTPYNQKY